MTRRIPNSEILEMVGEWESLKPTVIQRCTSTTIGVNRSLYQLGSFKELTIKLSVAAEERGLATGTLDAVAADPVTATKANWDAADVTIGKLKIMACGTSLKSQNRLIRRTQSPNKPEPPLATPDWSFVHVKNSGWAVEKERKSEPKLAEDKPDWSRPMSKKTMAVELQITVRKLNELAATGVYTLRKHSRKTYQIRVDDLANEQRIALL
jgi:hypothetical protein